MGGVYHFRYFISKVDELLFFFHQFLIFSLIKLNIFFTGLGIGITTLRVERCFKPFADDLAQLTDIFGGKGEWKAGHFLHFGDSIVFEAIIDERIEEFRVRVYFFNNIGSIALFTVDCLLNNVHLFWCQSCCFRRINFWIYAIYKVHTVIYCYTLWIYLNRGG